MPWVKTQSRGTVKAPWKYFKAKRGGGGRYCPTDRLNQVPAMNKGKGQRKKSWTLRGGGEAVGCFGGVGVMRGGGIPFHGKNKGMGEKALKLGVIGRGTFWFGWAFKRFKRGTLVADSLNLSKVIAEISEVPSP